MTHDASVTCCFTGHRAIPASDAATVRERLALLLSKLYREGFRHFLAGGALGFDTLAARAVLSLRETHPDVTLTLVLPCADQDARWHAKDRAVYAALKEAADEVICLAERYYDGCMKARNQYMVDRASACIAYLTRSGSGAGQTLRMAEKAGLRLFNTAPIGTQIT